MGASCIFDASANFDTIIQEHETPVNEAMFSFAKAGWFSLSAIIFIIIIIFFFYIFFNHISFGFFSVFEIEIICSKLQLFTPFKFGKIIGNFTMHVVTVKQSLQLRASNPEPATFFLFIGPIKMFIVLENKLCKNI